MDARTAGKSPFQSVTAWGIMATLLVALVGLWVVDTPGGGVALAAATTKKITETILLAAGAATAFAGRVRARERMRVL